jgi:hypothetical protein
VNQAPGAMPFKLPFKSVQGSVPRFRRSPPFATIIEHEPDRGALCGGAAEPPYLVVANSITLAVPHTSNASGESLANDRTAKAIACRLRDASQLIDLWRCFGADAVGLLALQRRCGLPNVCVGDAHPPLDLLADAI